LQYEKNHKFVLLKLLAKYIISFLIFLFAFEITFEFIQAINNSSYSIVITENEEGKEKDDDKLEKEKYSFNNNLLQNLSSETSSIIEFKKTIFLNMIQPHFEVATPPPDFC